MFKTRLISGIILVITAILTIRAGGYVLAATLMALSVIGLFELYRACGIAGGDPLPVTGAVAAFGWYVLLSFPAERFHMLYIIGVLLACMAVYVLTYPRYRAEQVMTAVFGFLYVPVLLSCIYLTRRTPNGHISVWLIFLAAWGADTCAYAVGMLIGKHKMAPVLSPKKSVEGGIGGVVGATALGALYALAMHQPVAEYAVICFFGSMLSMIGDLAASAIKRNVNIKDYGKLIPGHGGVLDRFDSILFTAPAIYFLSLILLSK